MELTINGEGREVPEGLSVARLLEHLEITPEQVAVEVDREVVPRASWDKRLLDPGASVEIVQFVGGG